MRSLILGALVPALALAAAPARAATLFSENFDTVAVANYGTQTRVGGFTVTQNDVDVFGKPEYAYACPSPNGADGNHCVDLQGNGSGSLATDLLSVAAGKVYTVAFGMAGNGDNGSGAPYTLQASFAGVTRTFAVQPLTAFTTMSFDVTPVAGGVSSLVLTAIAGGQPNYWGAIIDDVRITTPDAIPAAVPEPATWAAMIMGFALIGGALRRPAARARRALA